MYLNTACKYTKILLVGIALPKHHFFEKIYLPIKTASSYYQQLQPEGLVPQPPNIPLGLTAGSSNNQCSRSNFFDCESGVGRFSYRLCNDIYIYIYVHAYIHIVAIWWLEFKIRSLHWIYQPMYMESGNARRGLSAPSVLGVPGRPETYCSDIPSIKSLSFIGKFVLKEICDFHNLSHHSQSSRKTPPWSPAMRKSRAFNRFDVSW